MVLSTKNLLQLPTEQTIICDYYFNFLKRLMASIRSDYFDQNAVDVCAMDNAPYSHKLNITYCSYKFGKATVC